MNIETRRCRISGDVVAIVVDFSDQRNDVRRLFAFDVYRRLAVAKARWDAGELFRSNHPIPPATIVTRRPRRSLVRRAPGRAARPVRAAR